MKKTVITTSIVIVVILAIMVLLSSAYTVHENEYALVLRFSKIEAINDEAGLHFMIPFIDTVEILPKNLQLYDLKPSDVLTSDSKAMSVDSYVVWKISDPLLFYKTIGTTLEAQHRLDAVTYNVLKNVIGRKEQSEIITKETDTGRDSLNDEIFSKVKGSSTNYGIEITDVKVKRFELPQENEEAVYRRMISERNQIAARYLAEGESEAMIRRNGVDKNVDILLSNAKAEAEELIAEGEAEYMKLLGEAYDSDNKQEFYVFMRSLEALKASLTGDEKTVILNRDSELAQILMGVTK